MLKLHLWTVTVSWALRRKQFSCELHVAAYTLNEASDLAAHLVSTGITLDSKVHSPAYIRHITVDSVTRGTLIDAIAPLREVAPPPTRSLDDLDIGTRAENILASMGITTVQQLCDCSREELLEVRNSGETTVNEIETALAAHGLRLRDKSDAAADPE